MGLESNGKEVVVKYVPRPVNMPADYIMGEWEENSIYDGLKDFRCISQIADEKFWEIVYRDKKEFSSLYFPAVT